MEEFQSCAPTRRIKFVIKLVSEYIHFEDIWKRLSTNYHVESAGNIIRMEVGIGCGPTQKKPFITVMGKGDIPHVWVYDQAFGLNPADCWSDVLAHPEKYHLSLARDFDSMSLVPNKGAGSLLFRLDRALREPVTLLQSHIEALNVRVDAVLRQIT
jgi:hypothetical protein